MKVLDKILKDSNQVAPKDKIDGLPENEQLELI